MITFWEIVSLALFLCFIDVKRRNICYLQHKFTLVKEEILLLKKDKTSLIHFQLTRLFKGGSAFLAVLNIYYEV